MQNVLLISDLHLNSNPLDDHRWGVLEWAAGLVQKYRLKDLVCLGDLTEQKDRHSSVLVNRLVDGINQIPCRVTILRGNHDYIEESEPYFRFLDVLPHVRYVNTPAVLPCGGDKVLMLPHTKEPDEQWKPWYEQEEQDWDYVFAHLTVKGSLNEFGYALDGVPMKLVRKFRSLVFSGDVHKAQVVGVVEYIGAPYDIKFGDDSTRSAILFDVDGDRFDLRYPAPRKRTVRITDLAQLKSHKIKEGDQIQVLLEVDISQAGQLAQIQKKINEQVKAKGGKLMDVNLVLQIPEEEGKIQSGGLPTVHAAFDAFVEQHKLPKALVDVGRECLRQSK